VLNDERGADIGGIGNVADQALRIAFGGEGQLCGFEKSRPRFACR
jgi:hypothetical protein